MRGLLAAFMAAWTKQHEQSPLDAQKYSRLSFVALSQLAATIAVDVGMTEDQFRAVCEAQYRSAFQQAPRWA